MADHLASHPDNLTTTNKWSITQDYLNIQDSNTATHDDFYVRNEQKLTDIRRKFTNIKQDPLECLKLVDAVQKAGIEYHFKDEIDAILKRQYVATMTKNPDHKQQDLYELSLSFRLLRQQGYYVPADVFDNFTDKEGKFSEKFGQDIRGLMGLYEASQFIVEGEDVLEEAEDFSRRILNLLLNTFDGDHYEAKIVRHTLRHPCHKSLARSTAKEFMRNNSVDLNACGNVLQELAKMDFDMVQCIHQKELLEISRWWKELGLAKELKFARDQPMKWHMWTMAALTDPSLSMQRIELTKPISLIYIIDDIFDVYGTLDELALFTQAVNRWEVGAMEQLPDYMKMCFKALYDITNEIGNKVHVKYGWNPVTSLQKAWASLFDAFLVEAEWFASGHVPKADEYLKNGIISSGAHVVLVHMFFLLGEGRNKESANIVDDYPGIITSVATILRLWDDLGSAKDENQDGHDGSYITCYMKEHEDCSVEIAKRHVYKMISEAWKRLNKECLSPNAYSLTFKKASLNLARMVSLMYSYDENQGLPQLEEHIKSMV
ncbi:hypothetical protein LguiB_005082 [Lonicera macranthoides]